MTLQALLLLLLCAPALAEQPMSSASSRLHRSAADHGGGEPSVSASHRLGAALGEPLAWSTASSSGWALGPGALQLFSAPHPVTNISGLPDVTIASVTLQWTSPGYDGGLGALMEGSTYFLRIASYTVPDTFEYGLATVVITTQDVEAGALVSTRIGGLLPNTTYYAHLWTDDAAGNLSFASIRSTFTTLAPPVGLASPYVFLGLHETSITANWAALPSNDASSMTAEGYVLEASPNPDFSEPVFSSAAYHAAASTLTVGWTSALQYCTTYYFRIGTYNWSGATNYLVLHVDYATSTLRDYGQVFQTHSIPLGDVNVNSDYFVTTKVTVQNLGTCPATFLLKAEPTTAGTPWAIASSSGTDAFTLQGAFNSAQPGTDDFLDEDKLTDSFMPATLTRFAIGQTGVAVPRGDTRDLWFKVGMPTISSTDLPQTLQVTIRGQAP